MLRNVMAIGSSRSNDMDYGWPMVMIAPPNWVIWVRSAGSDVPPPFH